MTSNSTSHSLELYKTIFENSPDAILLTLPSYQILEINSAFKDMFGYSKADILDKNLNDVFPEVSPLLKELESLKVPLETFIPSKKGEEIFCQVSAINFKENESEIVMIFIKDLMEQEKAEKEIIESESKYRNAMDNMMEGCQIISPQWKYLYLNDTAIKHSRFPREKLINHTMMETYPGIEDTEMFETLKKSMEKRVSSRLTNVFVFQDGKKQWFELNAHPVPEGLFILSMDVTERINIENELKKSEEKYRTIYSSMGEGMAFHKVIYNNQGQAVDYEILDVNPTFEALINIKKEDIVGKKASKIYGTGEAPYLDIYAEVAETRQPKKFETYFETMQMYFRISVVSPSKGFFTTVFEDITERIKIESELKASESRYHGLFDKSPNYLFLASTQGIIIDINEITVDFTGRSKEELIGKHISEMGILPPQEIPVQMEKASLALQGEKVKPFESILIDKNGQKHYVIINSNTLKKDGEIFAFQIICNDVTDLKVAEKEIRKSLHDKELLLQEIHHRVKNNMQIISSLLNLQSYQVREKETQDILKDSQSRIKAMSMVHEKLYQSSDLSHINVKEYVEKLVQDLFYSYEVKGHVDFQLEVEEVEMNMETMIPLGLIINELVTNSLKFAFPEGGGSLGVSLKTENHEHTLMVYDDGIGMDAAVNIHKPGTLGLKLVESLVDQLDAEMKLDTSEGTKFIIKFREMKYKERI